MIHVHTLDGCAPAPLAHYLKALGILRLLAEQVDSDARGWWEGDHFRLAMRLDRGELERFFLYGDYVGECRSSPSNRLWPVDVTDADGLGECVHRLIQGGVYSHVLLQFFR